MTRGKTLIIMLVTLIIGLGAGFVLPSVIVPAERTAIVSGPPDNDSSALAAPRGMQYFAAHIDEAGRIVAQCKEGSKRGDECINAEQALTEAEGRKRFKNFMSN